jgi:hypothetical protein
MPSLIEHDHRTGDFLRLTDLVVDLINLGKERDEIIDFLKKKMVENTDIYFAYMSAKTLIKLREMPLPPSHEDVI